MIKRLRRRRTIARGLPLAFAALVFAPSAVAGVRLRAIDTAAFPAVRATLVAPLGAATPHLSEDGRPVVGYSAVNLGQEKAIVLALDRSQSMRGRPLESAVSAAQAFVAAARPRDHVGVVVFGHSAFGLTRPSTPTDAQSALDGLSVDPTSGTALYDAIVLAARRLSTDERPGRAIVVVTDGRDVSSTHSLEQAITAAHRASAAVYAIGIGGPSFTPDALRRLASETGGSYRQARNAAGLSTVYGGLAAELARTWQLTYVTSARPGSRIKLTAMVAGAGPAHGTAVLSGESDAPVPPSGVIPSAGYSTMGTLVVASAVGLLVLLACGFWFAARRGGRLRARIEPHLGIVDRPAKARRRDGRAAARARLADLIERAFGEFRQFKRLQRAIDRADLPIRLGELVALAGGIGFALAFVAALAGSSALVILVALVLGAFAPIVYVFFKANKRIKVFDNQLPDILITIAASLKAGHSFRQGIQAVVEEGTDPAAREFRRVLNETQLGRPMDEALADLASRIESKNLTFVINAVTIQRQIGGSLAGLFDMVADTVRQRQQFVRKVRGLTAMGRMSSYVLIGLPFCVGLAASALNPGYMAPLFHTSTGQKMIIVGVIMISVGSVILNKIASFKG
jgi:tight adherence protein B